MFPKGRWIAAFATLLLLSSGCSTLELNSTDPDVVKQVGSQRLPAVGEISPDAPPTFIMDVHPKGKATKSARLPYEEAMTVQEALVKAGVVRQFRRMDIELHRQLLGGGTHKIDVEFDAKSRSVPDKFDYALHPNDRLVVLQDTSTAVDDMLGSISSTLGLGQ